MKQEAAYPGAQADFYGNVKMLLDNGRFGGPQVEFVFVAIGILSDLAAIGGVVFVGGLEGAFDFMGSLEGDPVALLLENVAQSYPM